MVFCWFVVVLVVVGLCGVVIVYFEVVLIWLVLIEGLLGLFVNVGEVVDCNLCMVIEDVNVCGGVKLFDGCYLFVFV